MKRMMHCRSFVYFFLREDADLKIKPTSSSWASAPDDRLDGKVHSATCYLQEVLGASCWKYEAIYSIVCWLYVVCLAGGLNVVSQPIAQGVSSDFRGCLPVKSKPFLYADIEQFNVGNLVVRMTNDIKLDPEGCDDFQILLDFLLTIMVCLSSGSTFTFLWHCSRSWFCLTATWWEMIASLCQVSNSFLSAHHC